LLFDPHLLLVSLLDTHDILGFLFCLLNFLPCLIFKR
jgi:hypothetical protein